MSDVLTDAPRRGRGRPKGTGKIDPDAIVEAALDALAIGGYAALSMRGLARTLGISLATLQHHHATKDALWRAALDHLTQDLIERNSSVDPLDLTGKIAAFLEQDGARPGLIAALLADRSPGASGRIADIAERFADGLAASDRRLTGLADRGVIRSIDHRALLTLMMIGVGSIAGAADGVRALHGFDLTSDVGRQQLATGVADIIAHGILADARAR